MLRLRKNALPRRPSMLPVMSLATDCHGQCSELTQVSVRGLYRDSSEIGEVGFSRASVNAGADLGGGCRGCAPPPPWDELMKPSSYLLLKFVYLTGQLRHFSVVHPLLRKILDPPLKREWNSRSSESVDDIRIPYLTKMSSEEGKLNGF